jgi:tRNA (guanosine-2'-O-)-methyltransferase
LIGRSRAEGRAAAAVLLGVSIVSGCGRAASSKAPQPPKLEATNLSSPLGTTLVQACTPTGPELCFNAVDDNCNGVIDEGCGLQTGLLQFTIAWAAAVADVGLGLLTPAHEHVTERSRSSASGFHLDRDCPSDDKCNGQNVENVYFDGIEPPRGRYTVEIVLVDPHGASLPVRVRVGARLGTRTVGFDVDLGTGEDAKKTFAFDLP